MTKYATDMLGHKLASTYHLVYDGEYAGRIDTCYGSGFGSCTATVRVWSGPWSRPSADGVATDKAGGGGYCRESAAVAGAINSLTAQTEAGPVGLEPGCGMYYINKAATAAGYLWCG